MRILVTNTRILYRLSYGFALFCLDLSSAADPMPYLLKVFGNTCPLGLAAMADSPLFQQMLEEDPNILLNTTDL